MNGFFLVNKEKNYTSNDVVQKIKKKFSFKKVGHLGTLDPIAEGLIILAVNRATKFSNYFLESDKSYFVEIKLGISTDTHDLTGQIVAKAPVKVTEKALKNEINNFLGASFQKPPYFSALKHKGRPLYEYARKGEFIDKEPRRIEIKEIKNITYKNEICSFELTCSKGTYIRSIARDLGENLGCGANMISLKRLKQHNFDLKNAKTIENIKKNEMIKIEEAFLYLEKILLNDRESNLFQNGQEIIAQKNLKGFYRIYKNVNEFMGLGFVEGEILKHKQLV